MNEQLEEFENQLEAMPKQKLYFIYVSLVLLLLYLSWNTFGEGLTSDIEMKKNSIKSLKSKLKRNNLASIKKVIKKTEKEKLTLAEEFNDLKLKDTYISTKLESIDFIFFNQMGIAKILDDILKKSVQYSIDIDEINYENVNKLYMANIFEREHIMVKGSASFTDTMRLMQYIDSIKSLLRINEFDIYIDDSNIVNFDINISNYGAEI
ncbi:MAG: hypothetical protein ABGW74_05945 [Campylobacterales bacterium]